jgi:hypothetical protein
MWMLILFIVIVIALALFFYYRRKTEKEHIETFVCDQCGEMHCDCKKEM